MRRCLDCDFVFVEEDHQHLQCRFHAPPVVGNSPYKLRWPIVQEDDWCGQFVRDSELPDDEP